MSDPGGGAPEQRASLLACGPAVKKKKQKAPGPKVFLIPSRCSCQSQTGEQPRRRQRLRKRHLVRVPVQRVSCSLTLDSWPHDPWTQDAHDLWTRVRLSRNEDEVDRTEKVEKGTKVRRTLSSLRNRMTGSFNKDKVSRRRHRRRHPHSSPPLLALASSTPPPRCLCSPAG